MGTDAQQGGWRGVCGIWNQLQAEFWAFLCSWLLGWAKAGSEPEVPPPQVPQKMPLQENGLFFQGRVGCYYTSESTKVLLLIEGLASQETNWGSTFISVSYKADPAPLRSEVATWAQGRWPAIPGCRIRADIPSSTCQGRAFVRPAWGSQQGPVLSAHASIFVASKSQEDITPPKPDTSPNRSLSWAHVATLLLTSGRTLVRLEAEAAPPREALPCFVSYIRILNIS